MKCWQKLLKGDMRVNVYDRRYSGGDINLKILQITYLNASVLLKFSLGWAQDGSSCDLNSYRISILQIFNNQLYLYTDFFKFDHIELDMIISELNGMIDIREFLWWEQKFLLCSTFKVFKNDRKLLFIHFRSYRKRAFPLLRLNAAFTFRDNFYFFVD